MSSGISETLSGHPSYDCVESWYWLVVFHFECDPKFLECILVRDVSEAHRTIWCCFSLPKMLWIMHPPEPSRYLSCTQTQSWYDVWRRRSIRCSRLGALSRDLELEKKIERFVVRFNSHLVSTINILTELFLQESLSQSEHSVVLSLSYSMKQRGQADPFVEALHLTKHHWIVTSSEWVESQYRSGCECLPYLHHISGWTQLKCVWP